MLTYTPLAAMALPIGAEPFDQAFYSSGPLTIAFESAKLTYRGSSSSTETSTAY